MSFQCGHSCTKHISLLSRDLDCLSPLACCQHKNLFEAAMPLSLCPLVRGFLLNWVCWRRECWPSIALQLIRHDGDTRRSLDLAHVQVLSQGTRQPVEGKEVFERAGQDAAPSTQTGLV